MNKIVKLNINQIDEIIKRLKIIKEENGKSFENDNQISLYFSDDKIKKLIIESIQIKFKLLNEFHLREYKKGGYVRLHQDITHLEDEIGSSDHTLIIYLTNNEDGETLFHIDSEIITIKPEYGKGIIFPHEIWHEGLLTCNEKKILVCRIKML